jgi:tripartite-type tricarboxylate transporter receptor subunit TctC
MRIRPTRPRASALPGRLATVLATALLATTGVGPASAADPWPTRAVRIVVPTSPGGITDVVTRVFAPSLGEQLGQPMVIDNRPGGDNVIGTAFAARAAPDGYTLLSVFDNFPINQLLRRDVPYDARRDFAPISLLVTGAQVLLVPATSPAQDLDGLLAQLRTKGNAANYATAGIGSSSHLGTELLKQVSGISPVAIHMKGGAPAMGELIAGRVDLMMIGLGGMAAAQITAGRVRPLAVASIKRNPDFPQVPALAERFPGFATGSWMGMVAPLGTPVEIVQRVHAALAVALRDPEVRQKLAAQKFDIVGSSPEAFGRFVIDEHDKWAKVIRAQGISAE